MKSVDIESSKQLNIHAQNPKKMKYIKLFIIILGILVIAAVIFILIAKFKFNFFRKEIYKVAEIRRDLDSVEYFNETRTMKSKLSYTHGEVHKSEQIVETKFVNMIMNKQHIKNDDYLNTAALIILDSKVQMEGKEAPLDSFNIFDEELMKKYEENPEGGKYPMALFHFYQNGTLKDIQLPLNSSNYDIQNMKDLINNVVPQLVRNQTEDKNNGVNITTKDNKKKRTFIVKEHQKDFFDKYSKTTIKGSRITKKVERDIEDGKLTEVRDDTNLFMETQKEENDTYLDFGIENFNFDSSSKIMAFEMEEIKNVKELIKKVISLQTFHDSEELMDLIYEKEKEEREEQNKNITEEEIEKIPETEHKLRNLEYYSGYFWYRWDIVEFNILGIWIYGYYYVSLNDGNILNYIRFESSLFSISLGNYYGKDYCGSWGSYTGELPLAKIPLGGIPVFLIFKIGGDFSYSVYFQNNCFKIYLSGSIFAKSGLEVGGNIARIGAGVKGSFLGADFSTEIQKNSGGSYSKKYIELKVNAGQLELYAEAYVLWWKVLDLKVLIWRGWSKTWTW